MADKPLRDRMAAAGRRRAEEHFGWSAIARRTAELYQRLLPRDRAQ
jgi:glycosyltransferase involved in cell wall biosynthesis